MNPLLDALSGVGYALDTPGAYLRGALSGRPGERASGRELLQNWGVAGENQPGLDWGDVGGFGAEMVLDPLSLAAPALGAIKGLRGIQAGTKAAQALSHSDDANPLVKAMAGFAGEESGALRPFMEIGRRTDPDYINSVPWWHGTATQGLTPETLDPMKTDPGGLFGRGIYKTASPVIAGGPEGYAQARMDQAGRQWTRDASNQMIRPLKADPALASGVANDLLGVAKRGRETLGEGSGSVIEGDLADYLGARLRATNHPEREANEILQRMSSHPELLEDASRTLQQHGFQFPPVPRPTVYEANTNLGKILDLDAPPPRDAMDAMSQLFKGTRGWNPEAGQTAGAMVESALPDLARFSHDPFIQHLRGAGYDALSHTGGLRVGGGRNLHQVLISLDPNDTISRVGRAGQITRFEPQDIPELLKRFGGT